MTNYAHVHNFFLMQMLFMEANLQNRGGRTNHYSKMKNNNSTQEPKDRKLAATLYRNYTIFPNSQILIP